MSSTPLLPHDPSRQTRYIHLGATRRGPRDPPAPVPSEDGPKHASLCEVCVPDTSFRSNYVRTTKYTLWTFAPKNLGEQLQKKANFYFLVVAILSCIPHLSPQTPLVSILPLVFVLSVTAVKEGLEDYRRFKSDLEVNNTLADVHRDGRWQSVPWRDLLVGDVVRVRDGEAFPADLVLLQSSAGEGLCSIETANLDGETNLKVRQAAPATAKLVPLGHAPSNYPTVFDQAHGSCVIESSAPSPLLTNGSWTGSLVNCPHASQPRIALSTRQLLLRGCTLANTRWVIGAIVFTGHETKIMLQNKGTRTKRSRVDRTVDQALYIIFTLQFSLCIFGAAMQASWTGDHLGKVWYLYNIYEPGLNLSRQFAGAIFTYLVLVSLLVPISLYVSMEMVKFIQAQFISEDVDMYYPAHDVPARARTSNLQEELGQIEYIFTDKTGTLTRNEMVFSECIVERTAFGRSESGGVLSKTGKRSSAFRGSPSRLPSRNRRRLANSLVVAESPSMTSGDEAVSVYASMDRAVEGGDGPVDLFLTLLGVCHTVLPSFSECDAEHDHVSVGPEMCPAVAARGDHACVYQAASPDELALVEFARSRDYFFHNISPCVIDLQGGAGSGQPHAATVDGYSITVRVREEHRVFQVIEVFEFDSDRKRMSIVARDTRDGSIRLFCKGADNVVCSLCTEESVRNIWPALDREIGRYAGTGLRTLVCATRIIPESEFAQWHVQHRAAKNQIQNRAAALDRSMAELEHQLVLLGATGVEDRLQHGVPDTLRKLREAGICVWMLTGDKLETAINIGRSCLLVGPDVTGEGLLVIDADERNPFDVQAVQVEEALRRAERALDVVRGSPLLTPIQAAEARRVDVAVIVTGSALAHVFASSLEDGHSTEDRATRFLRIAMLSSAVVCARMSPKQKSRVVSLVKAGTGATTLAIGDGANDVAMIEAADVGVGLEGHEGRQAVMSSDYSIGQFEFLQRLLFVHGAWSYRRMAVLILYCFYKNVALTMTQMWFAFYCAFSGQVFADVVCASLYNMVFTALPVLAAAVFNRDLSKDVMLEHPRLYMSGIANRYFSKRMLFMRIFEGVFDSLILFFFTVWALDHPTMRNGQNNDLWTLSTAMFTCLVLVVNLKIALETTTWVTLSHVFFWLTIASWFIWIFIYCGFEPLSPDMYWVFYRLAVMPQFWLVVLLTFVTCGAPAVAYRYVRMRYYPTEVDVGLMWREYLETLQFRRRAAVLGYERLGAVVSPRPAEVMAPVASHAARDADVRLDARIPSESAVATDRLAPRGPYESGYVPFEVGTDPFLPNFVKRFLAGKAAE